MMLNAEGERVCLEGDGRCWCLGMRYETSANESDGVGGPEAFFVE